jgi:hypothetical protein
MDYNKIYIDDLTKVNHKHRQFLFDWLAQQGEATKIDASKLQSDLVNQYYSQYEKEYRSEFFYSMLILALIKMHWSETALSRKNILSDGESRDVTKLRIDRLKALKKTKGSPKKELIRIRFFEEIAALKSQGLSWRQIADYIHLHHKKRFTFGYLRTCFIELTAEIDGIKDDTLS